MLDAKSWQSSLKAGHQSLVDTIAQVQLHLRDYQQTKPLLRELYEKWSAHLSRQNRNFYDELYGRCRDDRPSTKMLDFLTHDVTECKIQYLAFLERHSAEPVGGHPRMFPKEFTEFSAVILTRITMEEEYLFPLLEKFVIIAPHT